MSWEHFMLHAYDLLRRPHERSKWGLRNVIQILPQNSVHNPISLHVISTGDDADRSDLLLVLRVWDRDTDYPDIEMLEERGLAVGSRPFRDAFDQELPPKPTISEREYTIRKDVVLPLVASLRSVRVPVEYQGDPPADGYSCEVVLGNYLNGVTFRWWGSGPDEWQDNIRVINELIDRLRRRTASDAVWAN